MPTNSPYRKTSVVKESVVWGGWVGYKVLRREFMDAGINFSELGHLYAIQHEPGHDDCEELWWNEAIHFLRKRKCTHLIAFGKSYKYLTGYVGGESYGIWEKSEVLPGTKIMAAPSPEALIAAPIGDLRVALKRMSQAMHKTR